MFLGGFCGFVLTDIAMLDKDSEKTLCIAGSLR